jgi:hypothetical protein
MFRACSVRFSVLGHSRGSVSKVRMENQGGHCTVLLGSPNVNSVLRIASPTMKTPQQEHTSAFNACSLLTPAQVQSIQSEPVTTKVSSQPSEFQVYHCFYAAPHVKNSVSVQVIRGSATHTSIRDFWNGKFHAAPQERQPAGAHDASPGRAIERDEEEQTSGVLEEIEGVGDEAYWTASPVASALYVLNGSEILRISVGGNDSR